MFKLIEELGLEPTAETYAYVSFGRDIDELEAEELDTIPAELLEPWTAEQEKNAAVTKGGPGSGPKGGGDPHTTWMNDCVPSLMDTGKDQDVAIAACLNMWRDAWEEAHPDGADDPGPARPRPSDDGEDKLLRRVRWLITRAKAQRLLGL
jgi:hypothetical protein